jgi:hypothetical protein
MYEEWRALHNLTRWLVLFSAAGALYAVYRGFWQKRAFGWLEQRLGLIFTSVYGVQIILGLVLYGISPYGMSALRVLMVVPERNTELAFFGAYHLLVMLLSFVPVQLGYSLAKRATANRRKYIYAMAGYTLGTLGIMLAIPWWRPWLRLF